MGFVRVVDHRPKAKALLPLAFAGPLVNPDVPALDRPFATSGDRRARAAAIQEVLARRFDVVVHVDHYAPSARVHRPTERRPEWTPGWAYGWVSVHEAGAGRAECQVDFDVRMDAGDAPLDRRLEAATRDRLIAQLGEAARGEVGRKLATITTILTLADPTRLAGL